MKKILSTLVMCVILGVGSVWAYTKSTVNVSLSPTSGAGTAGVRKTATGSAATSQTQTTGDRWDFGDTHTYYLTATTTSDKWLWRGWEQNGSIETTNQESTISFKGSYVLMGAQEGKTKEYTAVWVQPKVKGCTEDESDGTNASKILFDITDPTSPSINRDVVFNLENNYAGLLAKDGIEPTNYYTESLTGTWNASTFVNNSSTYTKGNQSYTYNVTYNVSGVHNTKVEAKIKLTSNYGGTNWTAHLIATENYMPDFTLSHSSFDYTPDVPLEDGASKSQTFTITPINYAAQNNCEWSVELSSTAPDGVFGLNKDNAMAPKVTFTALEGLNAADLSATLTIKCTYTDAASNLVTETKTISLSGDAGKVITIDNQKDAVLDFDLYYTKDAEATATEKTVVFFSTLPDVVQTPAVFPSNEYKDYITYNWTGSIISAQVKNNMPLGQYVPTLTYTSSGVEATLTLNINVGLAKPIVTATSNIGHAIKLSWPAVYGATGYSIENVKGETITEVGIITAEDPAQQNYEFVVDKIGNTGLFIGEEYIFVVTAIYDTNELCNRTSAPVTVTPTIPSVLTTTNIENVKFCTGTEIYNSANSTYRSFPYRQKTNIDLSYIFNENGTPNFDYLYIFGLTTSTTLLTHSGVNGHQITKPSNGNGADVPKSNSNAMTPCYIFKANGNEYSLNSTFEMNTATKNNAFKAIDLPSGTKIYMTGYCPYASCGHTKSEMGVLHFKGGAGERLDLYLNDLQLYSRPKCATGVAVETVEYSPFGLLGSGVFVEGSGAVFVFQSETNNTENPYQPSIHLMGNSKLDATAGLFIVLSGTDKDTEQNSAPIHMFADDISRANTLTIDDIWVDGKRTNGYLNLAKSETSARCAPTIDLGSKNGTLCINGGQLRFQNAVPTATGAYVTTFAISHRTHEETMSGMSLQMHGIGSDQRTGTVIINDGSISCTLVPQANFNSHKDKYRDRESMKCPENTYLNGGTYTCNIWACTSPANLGASPNDQWDNPLCKKTISSVDVDENGLAKTTIDWSQILFPTSDNPNATLKEFYDSKGKYYGTSSLAPDENGEVHLMLPCPDGVGLLEVVTTNWETCTPTIEATASFGMMDIQETIGGDVAEIVTNDLNKLSKLLYGEIDQYVNDILMNGYTTPPIEADYTAEIQKYEDPLYQNIENEGTYIIQDKIYWLKPVVANQWTMFVPPFDISNVYVIESCEEDYLVEKTKSDEDLYPARILQAERTLDLFFYWLWQAGLSNNPLDIWSSSAEGIITKWKKYIDNNYNYTPSIQQLYHYAFNGEYPDDMTCWDANFYLYESRDDENPEASNLWNFDGSKFTTKWKEINTISKRSTHAAGEEHNVIMKKGGIYSLCFPYSIYNDGSHDPEVVWDYWTGKYVIFEGYGPQELNGTNSFNPAPMYSGTNSAQLGGNSTFCEVSMQADNAYYLNYAGANTFTNSQSQQKLRQGEGFLLANYTSSLMMQNRVKSINLTTGEVLVEPNITTSTPTIAGNSQMMVYTIDGGVGVIPVIAQQVSIYNAAGQLITSQYLTEEVQIPLPAGIYLISGEKEQAKVIVK